MSQALEGLKVLDLTMNLPGPYMTWLLAVMGAEVVKVENPVGGDYARALGGSQDSPFFAAVNRNKKSLALNLKHPEGKKLLLELVDTYDVLVEGFRPGTMERLGLDFDAVSARNPRLIYVSITGYGHDGPYRLRAGHDVNYLVACGDHRNDRHSTREPRDSRCSDCGFGRWKSHGFGGPPRRNNSARKDRARTIRGRGDV